MDNLENDVQTIQVNFQNLSDDERNKLLSLLNKASKQVPDSKVWKPKKDENYYFIYQGGNIYDCAWDDDRIDNRQYDIGNCFKTKEEALNMVEKLQIHAELKRFAEEHNEFEIDWNYSSQGKYAIVHSIQDNNITIISFYGSQCANNVYFTSYEIAEKAMETIGKDRLKKYYFGID